MEKLLNKLVCTSMKVKNSKQASETSAYFISLSKAADCEM
jgi:hypothetical protein